MEKDNVTNECCDECGQMRLLSVYVQGRDTHNLTFNGIEYKGYMPEGLGLMGNFGDAIEFQVCMHCGKIQGTFPKSDENIKQALTSDDE